MPRSATAGEHAAFDLIVVIGQTIRDLKEVPSGHLYARVMHKITIDTYNLVIDALIRANLVKRDNSHMLTWIGPAGEEQ